MKLNPEPQCHDSNSAFRMILIIFITALIEHYQKGAIQMAWRDKLMSSLLGLALYYRFVLDTGVADEIHEIVEPYGIEHTFVGDAVSALTFFAVSSALTQTLKWQYLIGVLVALYLYHHLFDDALFDLIGYKHYTTVNDMIRTTIKLVVASSSNFDMLSTLAGIAVFHTFFEEKNPVKKSKQELFTHSNGH